MLQESPLPVIPSDTHDVIKFYGTRRVQEPETRLMQAMLEDALRTLAGGTTRRKGDGRHSNEIASAKHWVLTDDWSWPLSFVNICEHLGFDYQAIRKRVIEQPRQFRKSYTKPSKDVERWQRRNYGVNIQQ